MNIALFASKHVGYEVARFLGENKGALCCLILDADDVSGCNSKILASSKVADEKGECPKLS